MNLSFIAPLLSPDPGIKITRCHEASNLYLLTKHEASDTVLPEFSGRVSLASSSPVAPSIRPIVRLSAELQQYHIRPRRVPMAEDL